eukprot:m.24839 g.24839  ORF g.24839 m.24839 type:complete len:86 (-) comp9138_c1_seq1:153-410(-)
MRRTKTKKHNHTHACVHTHTENMSRQTSVQKLGALLRKKWLTSCKGITVASASSADCRNEMSVLSVVRCTVGNIHSLSSLSFTTR